MNQTYIGTVPKTLVNPVQVTTSQRKIVAMMASLLLRYPGADFDMIVKTVASQIDDLPGPIAEQLHTFLEALRLMGFRGLEEHYVETFDQRRRCSLFLSYYAVGDTRQRGAAILAFRQQLAGLGLEEISDELPDHLCVLLEALAITDDENHRHAVEMVSSHRDGLEVLRSALISVNSPYQHVVTAVCMSLPQIDEETIDRYIELIRSGPPAELVGIDVQQLPFPTAQPDQH